MEPAYKKTRTIVSGKNRIQNQICKNFFSTSGCPYGEKCHYLHYIDPKLSYNPIKEQNSTDLGSHNTRKSSENSIGLGPQNKKKTSENYAGSGSHKRRKSSEGYKTQLCNSYGTDEGCIFGEKCHFAHGENDLRWDTAKTSFGELSQAKISFSASLASGIIGKGGANTKKICHLTGVKLYIRDHESDPRLKNIEFEGPFESISKATEMVRELIERNEMMSRKQLGDVPNKLKTKLCEKFDKGSCRFGDECHFAHGASELKYSEPWSF